VKIVRDALEKIFRHCIEEYPYECCGLLVGIDSGGRTVHEAVRLSNIYQGDRRVRYAVDPIEYLRVERWAEENGMRVVGVYHSHPNVAARPSSFDLEHFFPWYTYLIVSVVNGQVAEYRAWRLETEEETKKLVEEPIS
jgi:proteasome lid subunit RPN8/RPN11